MSNEVFQKIIDILLPALPRAWKKLLLYVGYTEGSYSMKFYTMDEQGVYTDCFSQKGADIQQIMDLFTRIDDVLYAERKALDDKHRWTVMTMIVEADGTMNAEFDYEDISENSIEYERAWEEKYLNK
jgi:hypothetical protein